MKDHFATEIAPADVIYLSTERYLGQMEGQRAPALPSNTPTSRIASLYRDMYVFVSIVAPLDCIWDDSTFLSNDETNQSDRNVNHDGVGYVVVYSQGTVVSGNNHTISYLRPDIRFRASECTLQPCLRSLDRQSFERPLLGTAKDLLLPRRRPFRRQRHQGQQTRSPTLRV